jgi:hypothetical protein
MTWLCELDPGANAAALCGASSWLWLVVVSQTETAGPDAACAAPELTPVSPAVMSAATANDAVVLLMRDIVVSSHETECNGLKHFGYDDESTAK